LFPRVVELLAEAGAGDVLVFGGGIIPPEDVMALRDLGVAAVFTPGAPMDTIVEWVRANVPVRA
jgi:methylmalonyl-CoA mutase C-terminal domain/subunit